MLFETVKRPSIHVITGGVVQAIRGQHIFEMATGSQSISSSILKAGGTFEEPLTDHDYSVNSLDLLDSGRKFEVGP
jgi:hypothetical protein